MSKQLVITADVETDDPEAVVAAVEAAMPAVLVGLVNHPDDIIDEIGNLSVEIQENDE